MRSLDTRTNRKRVDTRRNRIRTDRNLSSRYTIALDSEGVTDPDGNHRTILFGAHDGERSWCLESDDVYGISAFDWLHSLPKARFVGFSFSYDWYMLLRHQSKANLTRLWAGAGLMIGDYLLRFTPKREFTIRNLRTKCSVIVNEVFGFYQSSFVRALKEWNVGSVAEVAAIEAMKEQRGVFQESERDTIKGYMLDECRLLVALCSRLDAALDRADIHPAKYQGAGSIAGALLRKHGIKEHIALPPQEVQHAALCAYYGGRSEISQAGTFSPVYAYDIRSAYPAIIRSLPCLTHAVWSESGPAESVQLCYVQWRIPGYSAWPPLPYRQRYGGSYRLYYPLSGEGWYWATEVHAARRMYSDAITIARTISLSIECDCKPFGFVDELYEYRKTLKAAGDQAQIPMKLGLNSLYGKMAQGIGWEGKRPPYQSYVWAGIITAGTRAMILDAIRQNPRSVLSVATDGILSLAPLDLDVGEKLGEWDYARYDETLLIMPGVYRHTLDGKPVHKTRGFGLHEVGGNFDALAERFRELPASGTYRYPATRFVGLGGALHLTGWQDYYARWITAPREVSFYPSRRTAFYPDREGYAPTVLYETETQPVLHFQTELDTSAPSAPYQPKQEYDDWSQELATAFDMA